MRLRKEDDKYVPGDYNIVCDVCGSEIKASQARQRWDGFIVCPEDWEPRHPQDAPSPSIKDGMPVYRPQLDESIDDTTFISIKAGPEE